MSNTVSKKIDYTQGKILKNMVFFSIPIFLATLMQMLDELRKDYDLSILLTTHNFSILPQYADQVVPAISS